MTDNGAWGGDGEDPWLPARLAATVAVAVAELSIYTALWRELKPWLATVARAVLTRGRVDPAGVWSTAPAWSSSVARVVDGPIRDTLAGPYRTLLGAGFHFDERAAATAHLSAATNRMVRTPDEVFSLITRELAAGANRGESIPKLAARVERVLSATDTQRWPNRATVIARTETLGALNAGRQDAFAATAAALNKPFDQMWIATLDGRTRSAHRIADRQRVPVGSMFTVGGWPMRYPGDPAAPGDQTIQCRCTTVLMEPDETVDLTYRQMLNY